MFKTPLRFLLLLLLPFSLCGQQNLVPNPDFEDTTSCPTTNDISFATGWFNGNFYSPDYYNACANGSSPDLGVPINWLGNQNAFNGNAYAGIVLWYPSIREYFSTSLLQPLVPGTKYFVSGNISRADSAEVSPYTCSCNNFGFRFTTYAYSLSNPVQTDNFCHVYSDSIIEDKNNWTRITGSFVADSSYQYLTIGNFYDDTNTDTSACGYPLAYAYYYVDAICVSTDSLTCLNWTAIEESNSAVDQISCYPIPANGTLSFSNLNKEFSYSVFNVSGQNVMQGKVNRDSYQIDVSNIDEGIYFLKINDQVIKILIIH